jgi:hypothetical protein
MKQLKLTITIGLVALATAALAQKTTFKERIFPGTTQEVVYVNTDYGSGKSGMEMLANHVRNWFSPRGYQIYYDMPEAAMTFYFKHAEVICEVEPFVESWMHLPFEYKVSEEMVELEPWMSEAFGNELNEYGPALEVWMTRPFDRLLSEEVIPVETWMAEPFENDLSEETMIIEDWMAGSWI